MAQFFTEMICCCVAKSNFSSTNVKRSLVAVSQL